MNAWTRIAPWLPCLLLLACGGDDDAAPALDAGTCMDGTFTVTNGGTSSFIIEGVSGDPTLTLCRGFTYTFQISATGHPFSIHMSGGDTSTSDRYEPAAGLTGQGTDDGDLVFTPDLEAPDTLHYQCEVHSAMTGTIFIVDP